MADPRHNGNAARINTIDVNVVPGGWEALTDDSNQWIKVDLGKVDGFVLFAGYYDILFESVKSNFFIMPLGDF